MHESKTAAPKPPKSSICMLVKGCLRCQRMVRAVLSKSKGGIEAAGPAAVTQASVVFLSTLT